MNISIKNYLLLTALFTCFQVIVAAQNEPAQRIIYDFSFQRDTNDVTLKSKDQYALDIFKDHSRFVSFTKLKRDIYIKKWRSYLHHSKTQI